MMETNRPNEEGLLREAEAIFETIIEERLSLPGGGAGWVGYDMTEGNLILKDQKGIYSGQLGIGIFFAAMYRVFQKQSYYDAVYESVDFLLEEDVDDLIRGSSIGSIVYGLCLLSELTGEQQYLERAREFAMAVTKEKITSDDNYDVLLGTGGTLLGLLGFYERAREETILQKAIECGEHLIDNRYDKWGYEVWDTYWGDDVLSFSTGMGHGAAGIGYSLYRLYAHTDRDEFRAAADTALNFENIFYSEYRNNWRANWTIVPNYPVWWCYGLSGVGLARLGSLEYHTSEILLRDANRARRGLDLQLASRDSVCHGTFSKVECLIEMGRKFDGEYIEQAKSLATKAIDRKRDLGSYQAEHGNVDGIYNPAFFLGTAGIGYTLLRLLYPDEIPSVLRFE